MPAWNTSSRAVITGKLRSSNALEQLDDKRRPPHLLVGPLLCPLPSQQLHPLLPPPPQGLTEYERQRLEQIRRNRERMLALNLPGLASELAPPPAAKPTATARVKGGLGGAERGLQFRSVPCPHSNTAVVPLGPWGRTVCVLSSAFLRLAQLAPPLLRLRPPAPARRVQQAPVGAGASTARVGACARHRPRRQRGALGAAGQGGREPLLPAGCCLAGATAP